MCRAAPLSAWGCPLAGSAQTLPVWEHLSQARIQGIRLGDTVSPQTGITPEASRGWARGRQGICCGLGWWKL